MQTAQHNVVKLLGALQTFRGYVELDCGTLKHERYRGHHQKVAHTPVTCFSVLSWGPGLNKKTNKNKNRFLYGNLKVNL